MFPGVINQLFALFLGVWLPQHVRVGWKRLVCVQGDALALPEVLLSNRTWKAAGPRAHLTSRAIKKKQKKATQTHDPMQKKKQKNNRNPHEGTTHRLYVRKTHKHAHSPYDQDIIIHTHTK